MKKILIVVPSMKRVAPITIVRNVCKFINKDKIDLYLFSLDKEDDELTYYVDFAESCKKVFVAKSKFISLYEILNIVRQYKINIIHANGLRPNLLVFLIKQFIDVKTIANIHSEEDKDFLLSRGKIKGTLGYKLNLFLYKNFDSIVAVSKHTKNYLHSKIHHNNIKVIYNGIEVNTKHYKNSKKKGSQNIKIGIAGKLIPIKRFEQMVETMNILVNKLGYNNIELLIAGSGPLESELIEMVNKYRLDDCVYFYGHLNNIDELYKSIDMLVIPSESEGFSLVSIEAQSFNVPVIVSNIGGLNETIVDGISGLKYEYGNLNELVEKILFLINKPDIRMEMGSAASKIVIEKFSAKHMANMYLKNYISL